MSRVWAFLWVSDVSVRCICCRLSFSILVTFKLIFIPLFGTVLHSPPLRSLKKHFGKVVTAHTGQVSYSAQLSDCEFCRVLHNPHQHHGLAVICKVCQRIPILIYSLKDFISFCFPLKIYQLVDWCKSRCGGSTYSCAFILFHLCLDLSLALHSGYTVIYFVQTRRMNRTNHCVPSLAYISLISMTPTIFKKLSLLLF